MRHPHGLFSRQALLGGALAALALIAVLAWRIADQKRTDRESGYAAHSGVLPVISIRGRTENERQSSSLGAERFQVAGELVGWAHGTTPPTDLLIVVHGLNNSAAKAIYKFGIASESLGKNQYQGAMAGFSWDADTGRDPFGATGYRRAKRNAVVAGPTLARFLVQYLSRNTATRIHLVGYSMGARVVLEALRTLDTYPALDPALRRVATVHLVGAAVDNEEVEIGERYGAAIKHQAGRLINYYSPEDDKLGQFYWAKDRDRALGEVDIEHPSRRPPNYESINVERELRAEAGDGGVDGKGELGDNHSGYLGMRDRTGRHVDDGVMDLVVPNLSETGERPLTVSRRPRN